MADSNESIARAREAINEAEESAAEAPPGPTVAQRASPRLIAVGGVAAAAVGLVPIGRLTGWKRAAYSVTEAPLVAFVMSRQAKVTATQRVAIGAAASGAAALGENVGVTVDRSAERWLTGRGARHPRVVIAVVSGVGGALWLACSGREAGPTSVQKGAMHRSRLHVSRPNA